MHREPTRKRPSPATLPTAGPTVTSRFAAAAVSLLLGLYLFYSARNVASIILREAENPGDGA